MPIRRMAVIAIVAVGLVVAGVAAFALSTQATGGATEMKSGDSTQNNVSNDAQQIISRLTASTENAPALGNNDAKVTLIEFGDYQCTWCHRWHESTKDTLVQDYVDTGKVRFLFKDFPINDLSDRASSMAAEASYCAGDQGKYWEYHDELYVKWEGENTGWVTKDSLRQFADNVGLEQEEFSECLDSGKHGNLVRENYNLAVAVGLNATPSFIILSGDDDPKLLRGAHPYSTFQQVIDDAYSSTNPKIVSELGAESKYLSSTFEPWKEDVLSKLSRIEESGRFSFGEERVVENKLRDNQPYIQTVYYLHDSKEDCCDGIIGFLELTEYTGSQIINIDVQSVPGDLEETARAVGTLDVAAQQLIPEWEPSRTNIAEWAVELASSETREETQQFGDKAVRLNLYDGHGYKLRIEAVLQ